MRCRFPDRLLLKLSHSLFDGQQDCPALQLYPGDVADVVEIRPKTANADAAFTKEANNSCTMIEN